MCVQMAQGFLRRQRLPLLVPKRLKFFSGQNVASPGSPTDIS